MTEQPVEIFAVTAGEYSDFGYRAVFQARDDAERALKAGLGDDIQEIAYYPAGTIPEKLTVFYASCDVLVAGVSGVGVYTREEWTCDLSHVPQRRPTVSEANFTTGKIHRVLAVGLDREAAVKACGDRMAQRRAEELGL